MSRVALITSAFLLGLFARALCPCSAQLGFLAIFSLFLGGLVVARSRMSARGTHILLAVGACAAGLAQASEQSASNSAWVSGTMRIDAVVESARASPGGSACVLVILSARSLDGTRTLAAGTRVWARPMLVAEGSRVRFLARVTPIVRFRNPSPHPAWPDPAPITYRISVLAPEQVRVIASSRWSVSMEAARARVRDALFNSLSDRVARIACALVLGDANAVSPDDNETVRNAGLAHVLAVSGMHVAILAGFFVIALRVILLRVASIAERFDVRRVACALGSVAALVYAEFAGGSPSAWRSAWTAAFAWLLVACGKRPRAGPVGACAALAMSVFDADLVTRPAFLLSVLATAALVALPCVQNMSITGYVAEALRTSLRASIATLPVLVWCFDGAPLVGVLANAALVPLGAVVLLPLATVHASVALFASPVAFLTRAPLEVSTQAFLRGCEWFQTFSYGRHVAPLSFAQLTAVCGGCAGLLLVHTVPKRALVVTATLVAIALAEVWLRHAESPHGQLRATFLDVWQGDSALIDLPNGQLMLVDAGGNPEHGPDPGAHVLLPLLRARRRDRVDVVVITHPHPDHYGGVAALLGTIPIGEIWDSGQAEDEPNHNEAAALLARARTLGVRVRTPRELCARSRTFGGAVVDVLAPCPTYDAGYDPNDNSLVIRVRFGRRQFLLLGDAEAHEESTLLRFADGRALDVLKVGHHGSRTSTTAPLLEAYRPLYAIVSAGRGNRFGHPHPETLARLAAARTRAVRLDHAGGTIVETDGASLTFSPEPPARPAQ